MFFVSLISGCTFLGSSEISEDTPDSSRSSEANDEVINITLITTADELQLISGDLDGTYRLENDIDLSGVSWTPIGTTNVPFDGTLDGNGFTISNLSFSGDSIDHVAYSSHKR